MDKDEKILLSHGAGGREMTGLINEVFHRTFEGTSAGGDDSARLHLAEGQSAFTTDAFVVEPLFFPGGDIGRLAVAGTVNDLLAVAARPVALSAAFILEEGLPIKTLRRIAASMQATAREAGISIVTGDTKVVPRGSADKIFIITSGVGQVLRPGVTGAAARPGDDIILSGSLGDHGLAVLLAREDLVTGSGIQSDAAPLNELVLNLLQAGITVRAMRDPTRGGAAAALNEIALQSGTMLEIEEDCLPVEPAVAAAAEALGLNVLELPNEGKMIIIVDPQDSSRALEVVRGARYGKGARCIGRVRPGPAGRVQLRTLYGTARFVEPPSGELLPRIC